MTNIGSEQPRQTTVVQETMSCMEVWGGSSATWSSFTVPGLDLWIYSQPYDGADTGGDIYYVSSCASGRITRIVLGDVSGHGVDASPHAAKLRDIIRRNVNYISQSRVVDAVNNQFEENSAVGRFATALIGTYFQPKQELTVCSAGHPPPLIFRKQEQSWAPLVSENPEDRNLPFGVLNDQQFSSTSFKLQQGDLIMGYSDALSEARDAHGNLLGEDGLATIANELRVADPEVFVEQLIRQIRRSNDVNLVSDDATVILARVNDTRVSLRNNVMAPLRLVGGLFQ